MGEDYRACVSPAGWTPEKALDVESRPPAPTFERLNEFAWVKDSNDQWHALRLGERIWFMSPEAKAAQAAGVQFNTVFEPRGTGDGWPRPAQAIEGKPDGGRI